MSEDLKIAATVIGAILLLFSVLMGIVVGSSYISSVQRLECHKLNAHRTAAEVFTVCNRF